MLKNFNFYLGSLMNSRAINWIAMIYILCICITYLIIDVGMFINYYITSGKIDFLNILFIILIYFLALYLILGGHKIKASFVVIGLILLLSNFWHNNFDNIYGILNLIVNKTPEYTHNLVAIVVLTMDSSDADVKKITWDNLFIPIFETNTDFLSRNAICKASWNEQTQVFTPLPPKNPNVDYQINLITHRLINPNYLVSPVYDDKIFAYLPNIIIYDAPTNEYKIFEKPWDGLLFWGKFSFNGCDLDDIGLRSFFIYQKISPKGMDENEFMVVTTNGFTKVFVSKKHP